MKYNLLNFNQSILKKINDSLKEKKFPRLDATDLFLLQWFLDYKATDKMTRKIFNEKEYYWVRYDKVREEFPFFELNTNDAVYRRFKKLENAGLLIHEYKKDGEGTYSFYNTTDLVYNLKYDNNKNDTHPDENTDGYGRNSVPKDPSTIDPSIFILSKDNIKSFPSEKLHNNIKTPPSADINKNTIPPSGLSILEEDRAAADPRFRDGFPFVDYWSGKPHLTSHKSSSKTYSKAAAKFHHLLNGTFGKYYTINQDYVHKNNISPKDPYKKWAPEEIYQAIDRYDDLLSGQYGIGSRDKLTKSCDAFLFNEMKGTSIFFTKAGQGRDNKLKKEEPLDPDVLKLYKTAFFRSGMNETEEQELIKCVNFVIYREAEFREKIEGILRLPKIQDNNFFHVHIKFLSDIYLDSGVFQINYIKWRWKNYIMWLRKNYGYEYNLDPDEKFLEEMRNKNSKSTVFDKQLEADAEEKSRIQKLFSRSRDLAIEGA